MIAVIPRRGSDGNLADFSLGQFLPILAEDS